MKDAKISTPPNRNTCCRQYTVANLLFTKRVGWTFLLFFTETLNKISLIHPFFRGLSSVFSRHENVLDIIIKKKTIFCFTLLFHSFIDFVEKKFKFFILIRQKTTTSDNNPCPNMSNLKKGYIILNKHQCNISDS